METASLPYWLIAILVLAYMGALFVIAWRGDRSSRRPRSRRLRTVTYALSLGIYCTSWTYYGAVGTAERSGWEYLGVYMGPTLVFALLFPLWQRVLLASKREKVGSIADFLSARYSKSRAVGALVTIVAVVASLPYIALQLKSLTSAWYLAVGNRDGNADLWFTSVLAAALAAFAILFGARQIDLTEHKRGLSQAIAVESVVKLCGIALVALTAMFLLTRHAGGTGLLALVEPLGDRPLDPVRLTTLTILSAAAVFCVPRQFQMGFVEAEEADDAKPARWMFPLYLVLFSLAVIPIAVAGRLLVPGPSPNPDFYVLTLPLQHASWIVTVVALLGGFSAAAAMVVVETVALSAMVSNHLILPWTEHWWTNPTHRPAGRVILALRQAAIILIIALATTYFLATHHSSALSAIGEISFAGAFQLAPALVAGVLWQRGHAHGAIAGIGGGAFVWFCTMMLPQTGYSPATPLLQFLGTALGVRDPLTISAGLSLCVNVGLFVSLSLLATPRLSDQAQAIAFVTPQPALPRPLARGRSLNMTAADLRAVLERFLGNEAVRRGFQSFEQQYGARINLDDPIDPLLARSAEKMLAGALGSTSARKVISRALSDGRHDPATVMRFLDEAAQAVQFNRELLQATLDNLSQGVSVVDSDLRLVAWNSMYVDMFQLPSDVIHVSRPISDIIRLIAERDERGADEIVTIVERRLHHLRRRQPYVSERLRPDGRVLKVTGSPIPGGGYVTSYTDVTDLRRTADALTEANETLEIRVESRTAELAAAKVEAEAATASKTRFLAAASHDVLQPLHAARLFIGSLAHDLSDSAPEVKSLLASADHSIGGAHRLLRALLDLSRLEQGGVSPRLEDVGLKALLGELEREFDSIAGDRGIRLSVVASDITVTSDRDLMRSILQNLIGNAVRYTPSGGRVLVGVRRSGERARIEIWDTGPGIPESSREAIFHEFVRLRPEQDKEGGVGLGLAIVRRLIGLLGHELSLDSNDGRGTVFRVVVPRQQSAQTPMIAPTTLASYPSAELRILCLDNEPDILEALAALLRRWGFTVDCARSAADVRRLDGGWDAALVDQHLDGELGTDILRELGSRLGRVMILTADPDVGLADEMRATGAVVVRKPVRPATLRAFLNSIDVNCAPLAHRAAE